MNLYIIIGLRWADTLRADSSSHRRLCNLSAEQPMPLPFDTTT